MHILFAESKCGALKIVLQQFKTTFRCTRHDAQSPSSNGKEIIYEATNRLSIRFLDRLLAFRQAHPLTKVGPISKLVALPEASMLGVAAVTKGGPVRIRMALKLLDPRSIDP